MNQSLSSSQVRLVKFPFCVKNEQHEGNQLNFVEITKNSNPDSIKFTPRCAVCIEQEEGRTDFKTLRPISKLLAELVVKFNQKEKQERVKLESNLSTEEELRAAKQDLIHIRENILLEIQKLDFFSYYLSVILQQLDDGNGEQIAKLLVFQNILVNILTEPQNLENFELVFQQISEFLQLTSNGKLEINIGEIHEIDQQFLEILPSFINQIKSNFPAFVESCESINDINFELVDQNSLVENHQHNNETDRSEDGQISDKQFIRSQSNADSPGLYQNMSMSNFNASLQKSMVLDLSKLKDQQVDFDIMELTLRGKEQLLLERNNLIIYHKQIERLNEVVKQKNKEIGDLQLKMKHRRSISSGIGSLADSQLQIFSEEIERLQTAVRAKDQEISQLNSQISSMEMSSISQGGAGSLAIDVQAIYEEQIAKLKGEIHYLKQEIKEKEEQNVHKQIIIHDSVDDQQEKLQELENKIQTLLKENANLRQKLNSTSQQMKTPQRINSLSLLNDASRLPEIQNLQAINRQKQLEIDELKVKLNNLELKAVEGKIKDHNLGENGKIVSLLRDENLHQKQTLHRQSVECDEWKNKYFELLKSSSNFSSPQPNPNFLPYKPSVSPYSISEKKQIN